MRVLVTGGSGVLGRATSPLLLERGDEVTAPAREELDLFDPAAVRAAVAGHDAILHLATRIPTRERIDDPEAWTENDRLRSEASRLLVDAALAAETQVYVQPTVAFVYPEGAADEETELQKIPDSLRSALEAEEEAERFAAAGRRGIVLRLGRLYGPTTGNDEPVPGVPALHIEDAASALFAALDLAVGTFNVVADGQRVSNERFKRVSGWQPRY
jgi:nucleoside-diphosphate-sugar epimerase